MAKRGPKPQAASVLRLRGSWRAGKRGVVANLDHKRPQRPQWLVGEGKKCWERLVPILHKAGLATELHRETLALLCTAWADFVEAESQLQAARGRDGRLALLIKTNGGGVMENPLLYTRKRAWDQLFKAAACFGLTPADIAGVRAASEPPEDEDKAQFFRGAG